MVLRRSKICEEKIHFMQTWSSYVRIRHNISLKHMTVLQNVMSSFCLNSKAHIGKGRVRQMLMRVGGGVDVSKH